MYERNDRVGGLLRYGIPSMKLSKEVSQGSHRLEKYLYSERFLEKPLKIKSALKSTGNSLKSLEKSLNSTIFL